MTQITKHIHTQPQLINNSSHEHIRKIVVEVKNNDRDHKLPKIDEKNKHNQKCKIADPIQTLIYLPWVNQCHHKIHPKKTIPNPNIKRKKQYKYIIQQQQYRQSVHHSVDSLYRNTPQKIPLNISQTQQYSTLTDQRCSSFGKKRTLKNTHNTTILPYLSKGPKSKPSYSKPKTKTQINNHQKYLDYLQAKIEEMAAIAPHQVNADEPIKRGFQQQQTQTKILQKCKQIVKQSKINEQQWGRMKPLKRHTYFVKSLLGYNKISQMNDDLSQLNIARKDIILPQKQQLGQFIKKYKPTNPQININKLVRRDNFMVVYKNENLYFGEVSKNKKNGQGIYISNAYTFQGLWKNDSKLQGYQITEIGIYKGKFNNNLRHLIGQFTWNNGQSYSGEWKQGYKSGAGVWKSGKGDTYVGNWIDGKVEGYGVHITKNGYKYEGNFINFLKHGQGKQTLANGDTYQGQYWAGRPHGYGRYTWVNNLNFEGNFQNGFRQGSGILWNETFKYTGQFHNDLAEGHGHYVDTGQQYKGQMKTGQKHGQGILTLSKSKQLFSGIWMHDKFHND